MEWNSSFSCVEVIEEEGDALSADDEDDSGLDELPQDINNAEDARNKNIDFLAMLTRFLLKDNKTDEFLAVFYHNHL